MSRTDFSDITSFSGSEFGNMTTVSSPTEPADHTDTGVGLSDATLSQSRRKLLDLVNRLHATGVQKDIDLPQIAVIGSQSAGKSSLIESISGITLPRAAGTCTRCPTECKLSHSSEPWKCIVSLRFSTGPDGRPLGHARNEVFGPPITDKSQVEERIRRAQRAILNPTIQHKNFLEGEDVDPYPKNQLSFSSNCVSLQISGPSVADLSFCDLPGLIASISSSGEERDIRLIESLLSTYITKPSCIILLTVACETDFENQGAHRITKAADPEGRRTIGVLTKPDRIPPGEEDRWISFLRNEREPLENNWYSVKQPNSKLIQQGVTWAEAREQERLFFTQTAPWSELDGVYQGYLGTNHLVNRLSLILSDLIAKRLPEIQEELQEMIQETETRLAKLPNPPSSDPFAEILVMLQEFVRDIRRHVEGVPESAGLLQQLRPKQMEFKRAIRGTAPEFRPFQRNSTHTRRFKRPEFLKNEEVDEEAGGDADNVIYIDEVMARAQDARTRELPGNYPFAVKSWYISEFTQKWEMPAKALCHIEYVIVSEYFKNLVNEHFASFGTGGLDQRVKLIVNEHIKICFSNALDKVTWLLALETSAFTLNTHYLSDYKDKFLAYYKAARDNETNASLMKAIEAYKPGVSVSQVHAPTFSFDTPKPEVASTKPPSSPFSSAATAASGTSAPLPAKTFSNFASFGISAPATSPPSTSGTLAGLAGSFANLQGSQQPSQQTGIAKILCGFAEIGVHGISPQDIAKVLPPDQMESAMDIMADVRAYFQVAYKRFADNVPLALDHEVVLGLSRNLLPALLTGLKLNGPDAVNVCIELMQENRSTAAKRTELTKKLERLRMASIELLTMS